MHIQPQVSELRRRIRALPVSVRRVAIEAEVDPKTVRNFVNGGDVRTQTLDAIAAAVGRLDPDSAPAGVVERALCEDAVAA